MSVAGSRCSPEGRPAARESATERLESSGPAAAAQATSALADRLSAEQRERWQRGDRVSAEDYLRRHPVLEDAPEAFHLVYGEFLLREELNENPSLEEYQRRFPRHAARLEQQVRLHRML